MTEQSIFLKNVKVHNLKGVDLVLTPFELIVFTGLSGSGKSSLAFDTIHVEGQRCYVVSLSPYAKRHLGNFPKPEADAIEGLSPTIAIEQKTLGRSLRSTVGTLTGIYDYLRVLFARVATPYCPISQEPVEPQSVEQIIESIWTQKEGSKLFFLSPIVQEKKGEFKELFADLTRKGFIRIRLDGTIVELSENIQIEKSHTHTIELVVDRITLSESNRSRLIEAVESALDLGEGLLRILNIDEGKEFFFSRHAYAKGSKQSYPPLDPRDFSFNHPMGMCPDCEGLGVIQEFALDQIIDREKSIEEDCFLVGGSYQTVKWGNIYRNLARIYRFRLDVPWKKMGKKAQDLFLYGCQEEWLKMVFCHPETGKKWIEYVRWKGIIYEAKKRMSEAKSAQYRKKIEHFLVEKPCPFCHSSRIRPYPSAARLGGKTIHEITSFTIEQAIYFFASLSLKGKKKLIGQELISEIEKRLHFLFSVGLDYLTLERISPTLSGGEAQRVRLASQLGAGLVGMTYVLDEPSIGLHPRDHAKLIETLLDLKEKGNTVIVVEHDLEMIQAADTVVDIGPGAGSEGGRIVAKGTIDDLIASPDSITGAYLSGRESIPIPARRKRKKEKSIRIHRASHHNLQTINAVFPLGLFVAVTGVSGCGKSSLVTETLYPALANVIHQATLPVGACKGIQGMDLVDKVILIDQTPIGRTPRSNPGTYIKVFDDIRDLFAQLPDSQARGYQQSRFSFNVKEGSCVECGGAGMVPLSMDFMDVVWSVCAMCQGKRFDPQTLSICYKGKTIADVLEMTVQEAFSFFSSIPKISEKLAFLIQVGLGYLTLGQSSTTLSGGEAQRIKLTKELIRPSRGSTLYLLDEPTTGLHFHDVRNLLVILQTLIDRGNSVVVIEHNIDVLKTADWIIDLGPEGGAKGGQIIGEGTPETIAKLSTPTGLALQRELETKKEREGKKRIVKQRKPKEKIREIEIKKCRQHNLKEISVSIPRGKISVCTGPSGAGKTSFALDTVYAEAQRRYTDSLSTYARQFIKQMPKPFVESITGLSPAIAIEQKKHAGNPRSTVGTITEIADFLRLLYAHLGVPYCPETGEKIETITPEFVANYLFSSLPEKTRIYLLSPIEMGSKVSFATVKDHLRKEGFLRIRLDGNYFELDEEIPIDPKKKQELFLVVDRIILRSGMEKRLVESIEQVHKMTKKPFVVATEEKDLVFNLSFAVPSTGKSYPPITPHTFSFNSEEGMCLFCQGLGVTWGANLLQHREMMALSASRLLEVLWKEEGTPILHELFLSLLEQAGIDSDTPLYQLPLSQLESLLYGIQADKSNCFSNGFLHFIGLNSAFERVLKGANTAIREEILPLLETSPCVHCSGEKLHPLARAVRLYDVPIGTLCRYSIAEVHAKMEMWKEKESLSPFFRDLFAQILSRLRFLLDVGLHYLSLDRTAPTLSGGEMQRIQLARQLGSGLTGCLYVLDEPTRGLHPENTNLLSGCLSRLASLGNTLLVVEHERGMIALADYVIDFGPGAGFEGGRVVAQGSVEDIKKNPHSLTGAYLSGRKKLPVPLKRRPLKDFFFVEEATKNNLHNLFLSIPLGAFTCITGVSGSGKSSLVKGVIKNGMEKYLAARKKNGTILVDGGKLRGIDPIKKLLSIDQNPIGHTIRADLNTYCELAPLLREFFTSLPEARARGLFSRNFSYNHKSGMCRACHGIGRKKVDLQFLPALKIECPSCRGLRLSPLSLTITYKGKNLGQLLQMTVHQAKEFFPSIPSLQKKLDLLIEVGLEYLTIGQPISSLSGGEAGRLRLAREMSKSTRGHALYLFDEPTVGLHSQDIHKLIPLFQRLVDKGHTLIVIEHNVHMMENADYMIDLGPGGGKEGGKIVAQGTPEEIAKNKSSKTGTYLFQNTIEK